MDHRIVVAALSIELSAGVGMADGLYFHLWKYKLYAHPASRTEHLTHTLRAILFGPLAFLLFARNFGGAILWATVALLVVDFAVESWDVFVERDSRAALGGLTPVEYWIHVAAITTHVLAATLVLAVKPAAAWSFAAPQVIPGEWPMFASLTALVLVPGAVAVAALHLWLMLPRYRDAQPGMATAG